MGAAGAEPSLVPGEERETAVDNRGDADDRLGATVPNARAGGSSDIGRAVFFGCQR